MKYENILEKIQKIPISIWEFFKPRGVLYAWVIYHISTTEWSVFGSIAIIYRVIKQITVTCFIIHNCLSGKLIDICWYTLNYRL